MLKISASQVVALAKARLRVVAEKLAHRMIDRHPDACARFGHEALASALEPEITFAYDAGLRSMPLLERYIDICAALGPRFGFGAQEGWAREILARQDLSPASKVEHLEETAIFVVLARHS